ncbi:hypothetical protein ACJIZ3_019914 [Penstemon smallii]|uniref:Uncharacterized protein n=1 Tax=Penstemon smallii TaxID=265156 RepID=A0ABD3T446_9LAMI
MKRKYASQSSIQKQEYIDKVKRSRVTINEQESIDMENQKSYETIQKMIQGCMIIYKLCK